MATRIIPPRPPEPRRSWFQIHLTTALILMFLAGLMIPTLIKSWDHHGFFIVLLVMLNGLMLAAIVCEYLIRNTRRRWNEPPHTS